MSVSGRETLKKINAISWKRWIPTWPFWGRTQMESKIGYGSQWQAMNGHIIHIRDILYSVIHGDRDMPYKSNSKPLRWFKEMNFWPKVWDFYGLKWLFSPREEGFILKCHWGQGKWLIHVVLEGKSPVKQSQNSRIFGQTFLKPES